MPQTARPVDPKIKVNRAASTFQIYAQQPPQSDPSILSELSFIAKQNLHCNWSPSELQHAPSLLWKPFCLNPNWGWKTHRKDPSWTITYFFVNFIEKRSKHWEIALIYYLFILFHARECRPAWPQTVLFCWLNGESWTPEKKARPHGGLALQNSAWLEVNHSLNLLKQLWRAFILFYGSLNRRASLEIWASLSQHWMLSAYCCFIERWVISQNKCRYCQFLFWLVQMIFESFFCTN